MSINKVSRKQLQVTVINFNYKLNKIEVNGSIVRGFLIINYCFGKLEA